MKLPIADYRLPIFGYLHERQIGSWQLAIRLFHAKLREKISSAIRQQQAQDLSRSI